MEDTTRSVPENSPQNTIIGDPIAVGGNRSEDIQITFEITGGNTGPNGDLFKVCDGCMRDGCHV